MGKGIKFLALVLFVALALFIVRAFDLADYLDSSFMRAWIGSFGVWGPLVFMALYAVAPALMFPGTPLTVLGGILFGPVWGSVYVLTGATVGASVAFFVARRMGRQWVESLIKGAADGRGMGKTLLALDSKVRDQGWKIVAVTRLVPIFPYNLLNYAFGLTGIRFSHYLAATFVFMAPGAVAYVLLSSSLPELYRGRITKGFLIGAFFVATISLTPFIYGKIRRWMDR